MVAAREELEFFEIKAVLCQ